MSDQRRPSRLPGGGLALDGVRGLAALLVVLTHVGYQTGETIRGVHGALLARADFGVALFFVLSGLLLYRPWVVAEATGSAAPGWRRYYRRRAVRILPAYWLALLAVLLLAPHHGRSAADVVANTTLTQVYGGGHLLADFTQTWSLCAEVFFYLLLPPVAVAVGRLAGPAARLVLLAAVMAANLVWTGLAATDALPTLASTWLPGHAGWLAAGMLLAALTDDAARRPDSWPGRWRRDFAERPGTLVLLAVTVAALAVTPLAGPRTLAPTTPGESVVKELLYGVVALLLVAAALVAAPGTPLARVLGAPVARWTGRIGYGVFLWHLLVLDGVMHLLGTPLFGGDALRVGVLTVAGSLMVAWLSWTVVERPLLDRFSSPVSSRRERDEQDGEQREQPGRAPAADRGA